MPVFWMGLFLFYGKLNWVGGPGRVDAGYEDVVDARTGLLLLDSALAGGGARRADVRGNVHVPEVKQTAERSGLKDFIVGPTQDVVCYGYAKT